MAVGRNIDIGNRPGCLLLIGLFWTLFSGLALLAAIAGGGGFPVGIGAVFVLIGLGVMARGGLVMFTRARVGEPEIHISSTTLSVGESFSMSLTHQFKRSVQVDEMLVQLVFRETATYQQGTDTRTVTHEDIIAEFNEPGRQFQAGNLISQSYQFQIPPSAMHTLKVRRNRLEWFVRFKLTIPNLPDFVKQIELDVQPELVS